MNLFKQLVQSAPVGNRLKFGYQDNIKLIKIDINERKNKGLVIKQNTYITLAQIDLKTQKIIAQSEGSYWNFDHTTDFVMQNFIDQFTSLVSLIEVTGGDVEKFEQEVLAFLPEKYDQPDEYIKTKEGALAMQTALSNVSFAHLKDKVGDDSPLFKCKITVNKKGFFELGKVENWILLMDSEEKLATITPKERKNYRESLKADTDKPVEPDAVGKVKEEKAIASLKALQGL